MCDTQARVGENLGLQPVNTLIVIGSSKDVRNKGQENKPTDQQQQQQQQQQKEQEQKTPQQQRKLQQQLKEQQHQKLQQPPEQPKQPPKHQQLHQQQEQQLGRDRVHRQGKRKAPQPPVRSHASHIRRDLRNGSDVYQQQQQRQQPQQHVRQANNPFRISSLSGISHFDHEAAEQIKRGRKEDSSRNAEIDAQKELDQIMEEVNLKIKYLDEVEAHHDQLMRGEKPKATTKTVVAEKEEYNPFLMSSSEDEETDFFPAVFGKPMVSKVVNGPNRATPIVQNGFGGTARRVNATKVEQGNLRKSSSDSQVRPPYVDYSRNATVRIVQDKDKIGQNSDSATAAAVTASSSPRVLTRSVEALKESLMTSPDNRRSVVDYSKSNLSSKETVEVNGHHSSPEVSRKINGPEAINQQSKCLASPIPNRFIQPNKLSPEVGRRMEVVEKKRPKRQADVMRVTPNTFLEPPLTSCGGQDKPIESIEERRAMRANIINAWHDQQQQQQQQNPAATTTTSDICQAQSLLLLEAQKKISKRPKVSLAQVRPTKVTSVMMVEEPHYQVPRNPPVPVTFSVAADGRLRPIVAEAINTPQPPVPRARTKNRNSIIRVDDGSALSIDGGNVAAAAPLPPPIQQNDPLPRTRNFRKASLKLDMHVEDNTSHFGPVALEVPFDSTLKDLECYVEDKFRFPRDRQKWIIGKALLEDERSLLSALLTNHRREVFLYITDRKINAKPATAAAAAAEKAKTAIEPAPPNVKGRYWNYETNRWSICTDDEEEENGRKEEAKKPIVEEDVKQQEKKPVVINKEQNFKNYQQLDDLDIIPNIEMFQCQVCWLDFEPGEGVVLRECLHTFCKECLKGTIEHCDGPVVKCPYKDDKYSCDMNILDREIRALVSKAVYEKHEKKSLKQAEGAAGGKDSSFHCKTPDCAGFCFVSEETNVFACEICKNTNCITCQAIHTGMDCKQYQKTTLDNVDDEDARKTKEWIQGLLDKNDALHCPNCQVLLLKKWGCDWVRCTYCRTELCWVTKQLRWGPGGKGDNSGGCKCMADGRTKCHPQCNYCH